MFFVEVLIVDDGSTDGTVRAAREAGADYIVSKPVNEGLGAAVRTALGECCKLGAHIGVMIDADNEYPADEIPDIFAAHFFEGKADYTMGSRFFRNDSRHEAASKAWELLLYTFYNLCFLENGSMTDSLVCVPFSRQAMEHGEIVHDYNYAQVLTLNLVRKGFRVQEVPITYKVRETGESFIKFRKYLFNVLPAIFFREISRPVRQVPIDYEAHLLTSEKKCS
ncbi:hypothetical protein GCM10020331_033770 [Ectobacillus funiculus]